MVALSRADICLGLHHCALITQCIKSSRDQNDQLCGLWLIGWPPSTFSAMLLCVKLFGVRGLRLWDGG